MLYRVILVSLRNLWRHPVRTVLILQGVIWGTALGVFPPAVINGSMRRVEEQAAELGTDRILLTQENVDGEKSFDWDLVARLRNEYADRVRHVTGMAVLESDRYGIPLIATDSYALDGRRLQLATGRFFTSNELAAGERVCVMEHGAVGVLGAGDAVGQRIDLLTDQWFDVIGVTRQRLTSKRGMDEFGYVSEHPLAELMEDVKEYMGVLSNDEAAELNADMATMIPHSVVPGVQPDWVELRARPQDVVALRDELQESLTSDGYAPVIYINAILPALYSETLSTMQELSRVVFVLCICVGTSVVCAIMVLSVVERRREIAIRRVEGARRWHIAGQFMIETGTLCTVGGLLGVPLGILLAILRVSLVPLDSVTWTFPPVEAAIIVLVVSLVGVAGGLLPAWRAMAVDPVEMLRYE